MTEHSRDEPTTSDPEGFLRRRLRTFVVLLILLSLQLGWSAYGWQSVATSFGWGRRLSFRNLSISAPSGTYFGNEGGAWMCVSVGPRLNEILDGPAKVQWFRFGIHIGDYGPDVIRYVGVNALWTLTPTALLAAAAGWRWHRLRQRLRQTDNSHGRGFAIQVPDAS